MVTKKLALYINSETVLHKESHMIPTSV